MRVFVFKAAQPRKSESFTSQEKKTQRIELQRLFANCRRWTAVKNQSVEVNVSKKRKINGGAMVAMTKPIAPPPTKSVFGEEVGNVIVSRL